MTFDELLELKKQEILASVPDNIHLSEICKSLGYCNNTRNTGRLRAFLVRNGADISHFLGYVPRPKVYENRVCPVCSKTFSINTNNTKELKKTTCSIGCSNTFFRSGKRAGYYKDGSSTYRSVCKNTCKSCNIPFACIICSFDEIIDVHHADEDKGNLNPSNLIPICANHHNLWHRDKPDYIMEKIIEYQDRVDSSLA